MSQQPNTLRTFVAVELPDPVKALIATIQGELQASLEETPRAVRWTRPEGIHLTLQFLGDTPEHQVDAITAAIERACRGKAPFELNLGSLGAFPNNRQARVLWVGLEGDAASFAALRSLQAAVSSELKPLGFQPDKSFKPHLTLGRVREVANRDDLSAIADVLTYPEARPIFYASFEVNAVSLMKSDLQPGGSVYTRLAHVELVPGA
jgi:2'-5' RNA ligase